MANLARRIVPDPPTNRAGALNNATDFLLTSAPAPVRLARLVLPHGLGSPFQQKPLPHG